MMKIAYTFFLILLCSSCASAGAVKYDIPLLLERLSSINFDNCIQNSHADLLSDINEYELYYLNKASRLGSKDKEKCNAFTSVILGNISMSLNKIPDNCNQDTIFRVQVYKEFVEELEDFIVSCPID